MLLILWLPANGNAEVQMEVTAAFGGLAVSGRESEIQIRLLAARAMRGQLEIRDKVGRSIIPLQLDELKLKKLWFPVSPHRHKPVDVSWMPDEGAEINRQIVFELSATALSIISKSIPRRQPLDKQLPSTSITPLILAPASLPHTPQGYAGIQLLITDKQSLSSLLPDQYQAFGDYLGHCNSLLLANADDKLLKRLQQLSGCSGRFIRSFNSPHRVPPLLTQLQSHRAIKLPSAEAMMSLDSESFPERMLPQLVIYLGGYIIFITLVTWRMKKTQYQLLLPAIVAAAGLLTWSGVGSQQLLSWAEAESGDSQIRIAGLLRLGGNRRGENHINIATSNRLSGVSHQLHSPEIMYSPDFLARELIATSALLDPQTFRLTSIASQSLPLALTNDPPGPRITALTKTALHDARLLWRGQAWDIPTLTSGSDWQPDKTMGRQADSPEEKLLSRRLAFNAPAVLLPFTTETSTFKTRDIKTSGWLVIRQKPEQA